jgi:hypothetical protein
MTLDQTMRKIHSADPKLANELEKRGYFLSDTMIPTLKAIDRLMLVLVRCGGGRFLCPVQDVNHFVGIIERENSDYVRDVSLPDLDC